MDQSPSLHSLISPKAHSVTRLFLRKKFLLETNTMRTSRGVMGEFPGASIDGWQILDVTLIANKVVYFIIKRGMGHLICKFYIEQGL